MANTGDGNLRLARSNVIYAPGAPISRGKERDPYYGVLQKYIRDWDRVRVGVADKCFCLVQFFLSMATPGPHLRYTASQFNMPGYANHL